MCFRHGCRRALRWRNGTYYIFGNVLLSELRVHATYDDLLAGESHVLLEYVPLVHLECQNFGRRCIVCGLLL